MAGALAVSPIINALNSSEEERHPSPELSEPAAGAPPSLDGVPPDIIRTAGLAVPCLEPSAEAEPYRNSIEPLVLDDDLVDRVGEAVEAIRGLGSEVSVQPEFITPEEMRARINEQITKPRQQRELEAVGDILEVLGAVEPGTDLVEQTTELYGGAVLGYYLPDTDELFVRSSTGDNTVTASGVVTLAHEMDHALTDQTLPWPAKEHYPERESEAQFAIRALLEGDAVLVQEQFAASQLTAEQQNERFQEEATVLPNFDAVPHFLLRSLTFPYVEGPNFVCDLYQRGGGGWDAVDLAYAHPPTSTDQIIFPGRLGEDPAGEAPPPLDALGGSWRRGMSSTIGTAELLFLFEAPGNDTSRGWPPYDARVYAGSLFQGWIKTWTRGDALALAFSMSQRDDYPDGALCTAIEAWYRATFPNAKEIPRAPKEEMALRHDLGSAVLTCDGAVVRLGIGPEPRVARATIR